MFEAQLSGFLAYEKTKTFLVSVLDGFGRILSEGPADHDALAALAMTAVNWKQRLLQGGSEAAAMTLPFALQELTIRKIDTWISPSRL